jgi:hypothetical protein
MCACTGEMTYDCLEDLHVDGSVQEIRWRENVWTRFSWLMTDTNGSIFAKMNGLSGPVHGG